MSGGRCLFILLPTAWYSMVCMCSCALVAGIVLHCSTQWKLLCGCSACLPFTTHQVVSQRVMTELDTHALNCLHDIGSGLWSSVKRVCLFSSLCGVSPSSSTSCHGYFTWPHKEDGLTWEWACQLKEAASALSDGQLWDLEPLVLLF